MTDLKQRFESAAERVKTIKDKPSDDILLELYGLYKQATVGDVNTVRPMFWDMVGQAKWDAWNSNQSMSQKSAKEKYIKLVDKLLK
jgi:diazepam-binding inhibitor (GABA receptor modulator, acyl-CoA-binding protein)